ncbi:hypothetical protein LMJ53_09335 [Rheinheimera sp. UJ51]|uniref:hypothetical protein n=1 Tax=unclassified Rheinheimera TaxID=115860 RepID=UPI001E30E255|nr:MULTISPECIES: hypothetical protein [unclassified Rheinheimera]MCC5451923.1 hypothetical protein [Rheinheimera sp. UJ51]MCF4009942.1 hypothetical protein [Rheinheimera sp. UJ63]
MGLKLEVTIESCWRGSILDTVSKIAEFDLVAMKSFAGLLGLEFEKSQSITLTNKEKAFVWVAKTAENKYCFSISHNEKTLLTVKTEGNFYVETYLPDGKFYQFKLTGEI